MIIIQFNSILNLYMYYYCNIIDNKSEIDSKMYGYIHNHTAFDEIVPHDSENNEEMP